jgi:type IV pilus assembly protein PilB
VNENQDFLIAALVEAGLVSAEHASEARRLSIERRRSVSEVLVEQHRVSERDLAVVLAGMFEVPFVDVAAYRIDLRNGSLLPRATAEALGVFPLFMNEGLCTLGMVNPLDLRALDQVRALLRTDVESVLCEGTALRLLIERVYSMSAQDGGGVELASELSGAAPVEAGALTTGKEPIVAAVNQVLADAIERGASDVHLGPDEHRLHLRFRVDGALQLQQGPPLAMHSGMVQRLKVMASLDLTQTRRPQDGKFRFAQQGRSVDVRVSIIPTVSGENVVLRLLTNAASIKDFPELGMNAEHTRQMREAMQTPHGMILVTGPTGSGKTTTLYSGLKQVNTPERNVVTIEDPVEIRMPLVRQVQTNAEIGLTFANALRSILRQDPDVILVGEIRDEETARIAIQAALTGHLVLSTLHTNDAVGAIPRLFDFGCPPFAIAGSLLAVVAQRLARRVCEGCAKPAPVSQIMGSRFGIRADERLVEGSGCPRCAGTGYKGRVGLYEILRITDAVQGVMERRDVSQIRRAALNSGMTPMWVDGVDKARLGLTTLHEVARVAMVAHDGVDQDDPSCTGERAERAERTERTEPSTARRSA